MGIFDTLGGALGLGGQGTGWKPQQANLLQTATPEQLAAAQSGVQSGLGQQQSFLNALQGQNGIGNQSQVFAQQQALANQLQQQSMGQGPNPAQQMLANATGQNVAQQAALMGSQRGAGANAGLMARQASQQGAGIQQQGAGQAALMGAQQQIAAQQQLQNQQQMMAGLAGQQVGQQGNALNSLNQFQQGNQGQMLNAAGNLNSANVSQTNNSNTIQGQLQGQQAKQGGQLLGGLMGAAGAAFPMYTMAAKGLGAMAGAQKAFDGGEILNKGGQPHQHYHEYLSNFEAGGAVGGQALVKGDSPKNDVVPAMLSPKEIVLPRSITMDKNAPDKAREFVMAIMARKHGMKK